MYFQKKYIEIKETIREAEDKWRVWIENNLNAIFALFVLLLACYVRVKMLDHENKEMI